MIDVHCHLNFHKFEKDYDEVIKKALTDGVTMIINVGTKIDSSEHAVKLAEDYLELFAIVGVHPHHADKLDEGWDKRLRQLGVQTKVLGIGEIGLDYFSYQSNGIVDPQLQKKVFEQQLMIAHELDKPLQIHNRQAGKDIIDILKHHKNYLRKIPGMFHCMSGDIPFLKEVLDLGFYVGFDGNITYHGLAPGENTPLSELVDYAPLDRIVTETDSPYLTPIPHRGTRNIPSYVIIVGEAIARIKGTTIEQVEQQTILNTKKLFNFI